MNLSWLREHYPLWITNIGIAVAFVIAAVIMVWWQGRKRS